MICQAEQFGVIFENWPTDISTVWGGVAELVGYFQTVERRIIVGKKIDTQPHLLVPPLSSIGSANRRAQLSNSHNRAPDALETADDTTATVATLALAKKPTMPAARRRI